MTTAAEIKRFAKVLCERDPRWVAVKRRLVVRPCVHWMCGVHLEQSSWEKGRFRLSPMIHPLYVPWRGEVAHGYEVDAPVERGAPSRGWNGTWSNCGSLLADVILDKLLPRIEAAATVDGFPAFLDETTIPSFGRAQERIFLSAMAGRLEEAVTLARSYLDAPEWAHWHRRAPSIERRRCERLLSVLENGQEATNRALRRIERLSARQFGVEKWWRWKPLVQA
jgi:hypothetical protein